MRKKYLDNIRWITVAIVVIYHVFYMYNGQGVPGVVGKITNVDVQYWDLYQYITYPWFMVLLFMVAGISSRLYLEKHTGREFIADRTTKLLVPVTIGLFAFQFIQGFVNVSLSGVFEKNPGMPFIAKFFVCILSGIGVLWFIQLLWLFSLALVVIRRIDRDRLWQLCGKTGFPVLLVLVVPVYLSAQILNTPIIVVYRFGLYFFTFLLGYFVFSHDEVIEILKKWFPPLAIVSAALGTAFCFRYFGENYADMPAYRSVLFLTFCYFACLAILGGMARYADFSTPFTEWMSRRSYHLYIFHYLGISSVGLFIGRPRLAPAPVVYLLSLIAGFGLAYLLGAVISRLPFFRWAVLGIKKKKKAS
ncbi:MAG: acyltransferase [Lachnospiraceae bacterium]|nr:acyltransferase [Lachnospiraceae bacterium]